MRDLGSRVVGRCWPQYTLAMVGSASRSSIILRRRDGADHQRMPSGSIPSARDHGETQTHGNGISTFSLATSGLAIDLRPGVARPSCR